MALIVGSHKHHKLLTEGAREAVVVSKPAGEEVASAIKGQSGGRAGEPPRAMPCGGCGQLAPGGEGGGGMR